MCLASGFAIYTQGAKELGMMNSTKANTLGAASNFHNPALLPEIEGSQIELGTIVLVPLREYTSSLTGQSTDTENTYHFPSTLFGVQHINEDISIGIGIYTPFGLSSVWPETWEGRYITTSSELFTININPNIAYRISDSVNLAVGVDVLYGDAELQQHLNLSSFGMQDGQQKFSGDGLGYGFNFGVYYKLNSQISFGASYRSKTTLDLDGKAKFVFSEDTQMIFSSIFPNTSGNVDVDLPPQFDFGLAYRVTPNFLIEVGGKWEGWSTYKELDFNFDKPINGKTSITQLKNWEDAWGVNIGIKFDINQTLECVGGYFHGWSTIPDETLDPAIVDSDKDDFSIGFIKSIDNVEVAVSYALELLHDRRKNNAVGLYEGGTANGIYEQYIHMMGISFKYSY